MQATAVALALLNDPGGGSVEARRPMAVGLFRKILVPVDFSPCSGVAFRVALEMARTFESAMTVLHVIDISAVAAFNRLGLLAVPSDATAQRRRLRHQARFKTRQLLGSQSTDGVAITRIVLEGAPFEEISKLARQERSDLIVLGSYGGRSESMDKIFFGATAEKVVRTAGCAVLTVPAPARKVRKDIFL
jgi:nucleotide-binding universal stress UspA family protein